MGEPGLQGPGSSTKMAVCLCVALAALVWTELMLARQELKELAIMVVAGGLLMLGRSRPRLRLPTKTRDSLKENKEWAIHQLKSNGR